MSYARLLLRSLQHTPGLHLALVLGVALTSAIISGSLIVGDSVKASLQKNHESRLSQATWALVGGERFFTAELADRLSTSASQGEAPLVPVLLSRGSVSTPSGSARVNQVQILGVDDRFWMLSQAGKRPDFPFTDAEFAANETLARQLGISIGETIIVNLEPPSP
ncbi:MAG: ABC transporter permease, partial [Verrucomicrobiota bacterium]